VSGHYRRFEERTIEEIGLQTFPRKTISDEANMMFCGRSVSQLGIKRRLEKLSCRVRKDDKRL